MPLELRDDYEGTPGGDAGSTAWSLSWRIWRDADQRRQPLLGALLISQGSQAFRFRRADRDHVDGDAFVKVQQDAGSRTARCATLVGDKGTAEESEHGN